jgi:4-aminobutyrate aminotransferase-like enzyme
MVTPKQEFLACRQRALGPAYHLFSDDPVHVVRGEGCWLYDETGRKYLDAYNNVPHVGHCHPHVVNAIAEQARRLNLTEHALSARDDCGVCRTPECDPARGPRSVYVRLHRDRGE